MHDLVCFVSPLHDPHGRLEKMLSDHGKKLVQIYGNVTRISVSSDTSSKIIKLLKKCSLTYDIKPEISGKGVGGNIRHALQMGIKTGSSHLHLVDFDRALHWVSRFPEELLSVSGQIPQASGYISLVRNKQAFETHPLAQRQTESVTNTLAAKVAGVDVDIMSGSFAVDRELAAAIVRDVVGSDYGVYAEILQTALRYQVDINTMEVSGLEWETPDQFTKEIEKMGYASWLSEFESLFEWRKRISLVEDSARVLLA